MRPNELRTVAYDKQLQLEAYRFAGIVQPSRTTSMRTMCWAWSSKASAPSAAKTGSTTCARVIFCCSTPATATAAHRPTAAPLPIGPSTFRKTPCSPLLKNSPGAASCQALHRTSCKTMHWPTACARCTNWCCGAMPVFKKKNCCSTCFPHCWNAAASPPHTAHRPARRKWKRSVPLSGSTMPNISRWNISAAVRA